MLLASFTCVLASPAHLYMPQLSTHCLPTINCVMLISIMFLSFMLFWIICFIFIVVFLMYDCFFNGSDYGYT